MATSSKRISSSGSRHHLDISNGWLMVALLVAAVSICTANAVASSTTVASADQKSTTTSSTGTSTQSAPATPHGGHGAHKDDIYIDDDAAEGSGHGGHRYDLDSEPDYSGSGGGPDDEDTVTHSRNNFHNKHPKHKNTGSAGKNHEEFDGSGDGVVPTHGNPDIRGENDDDEDNRFGHTSVRLPTGSSAQPGDSKQSSKGPDDDLHIDEGDEEDEEKPGVDLDGEDEDNDEDDDEDEDNDHEAEEDHDTHAVDVPEKTGGVDPTTSDDEDLGIGGTKDEDEEETIHRGLDPYPEDKDRQNVGGANSGSSGTVEKGNEVLIMNAKNEDRTTSFFSQPGILAAVIGGAVVGLLCAILVVMFIVYRMRKKDEGSYALDEPKRSPAVNSYAKNTNNREFYA